MQIIFFIDMTYENRNNIQNHKISRQDTLRLIAPSNYIDGEGDSEIIRDCWENTEMDRDTELSDVQERKLVLRQTQGLKDDQTDADEIKAGTRESLNR